MDGCVPGVGYFPSNSAHKATPGTLDNIADNFCGLTRRMEEACDENQSHTIDLQFLRPPAS